MKPRWLQLHLSTAIILSLVAGGLLWLNTESRMEPDRTIVAFSIFGLRCNSMGWPLPFVYWASGWGSDTPSPDIDSKWQPMGLLVDILVALAIFAAVYALAEWRIRSRESGSTS